MNRRISRPRPIERCSRLVRSRPLRWASSTVRVGRNVLHIVEQSEALMLSDATGRARTRAWMFAALNSVEPPIQTSPGSASSTSEAWALARVSGRPALQAYQQRCEARPAFQKALADHLKPFETAAA